MHRHLTALLLAIGLSAQTTPAPQLDKAPPDVEDALRARIKEFYDLQVAHKYRQAEQVVAEESKDDFYSLSKPDLRGYKIGRIEYSENFTKAKVLIVGSLPVLLAWAGGKIMDMPFASYWKIENGQWSWYYNKEALRHTPFGDVKNAPDPNAPAAAALPVMPPVSISQLQSAIKIDRTHVEITASKPGIIKVTNTLPGPASLTVTSLLGPLAETGITATFDKKDLKGNETATLTLAVAPDKKPGLVPLQITVLPTNQVLNLTVNIARD